MAAIDLDALNAAPLSREPFDHVVVADFLRADAVGPILDDFPAVARAGSYPVGALAPGPHFAALVAELEGPAMTAAMERKFGIDLTGRPTMVTVRGQCRGNDGRIHTDSRSKLLTVLLYLNREWPSEGGRLRLLRGAEDLDDYAAEVPPLAGTLLAFRCTEAAFHGHRPFEGMRRSLQLNWVASRRYLWRERLRHGLSAASKAARTAANKGVV